MSVSATLTHLVVGVANRQESGIDISERAQHRRLTRRVTELLARPRAHVGMPVANRRRVPIVLPVLLLIVLAALDFGRVFMGWVVLNNAARVAANYAAANPNAWDSPGNPAQRAAYQTLVSEARDEANSFSDATRPSLTQAFLEARTLPTTQSSTSSVTSTRSHR